MGDYYFAMNFYEHRGNRIEERRTTKVIRSEDFATKDFEPSHLYREVLGVGSCGIWFYETALWDKDLLKEKLHELVDVEIDKFFKEYDTYGKQS